MMKKLVLIASVAAVAIAFAPTVSFAKKAAAKPCTPGALTTGKANSMGWGPVSMCGLDGKWYPTLMSCYVPSGICPK